MSVPVDPSEFSPSPAPSSRFCTTHWSLVAAATHAHDPASAAALESLCLTYWYPLYAFVRRQGRSAHDAQDVTQEFFARLLEKNYLHAASAAKGRFRTFLLVALKRFLAKEWDRSQALKRGGGRIHVPLDAQLAESRYLAEPADTLDPERIFERRWAATLLDESLQRLRGEYERSGRGKEFEQLKEFLAAERGSIPYDRISASTRHQSRGSPGPASSAAEAISRLVPRPDRPDRQQRRRIGRGSPLRVGGAERRMIPQARA